MIKTICNISGMSCSMCESHINDIIRRNFNIKKEKSSHKKAITEIISESALDHSELKKAIEDTGYTPVSVSEEPYEKKGLFW